MLSKYKKCLTRIMLLLVLLMPISSVPVMAAGNIVEIPEDEEGMQDAIEQLQEECGEGEYLVFKDTTDNKYYGGKGTDIFFWLKDKYGSETWVNESDLSDTKPWSEVDKKFDSLDAISFSYKASGTGSATMFIMKYTIVPVLTMTQSEYEFVKRYIDMMVPIGFTLCLMYTLLYLANCNLRDLKSPETLIYAFLKFIIGVAFVQASPLLAKAAFILSNSFMYMFMDGELGAGLDTAFTSDQLITIAMSCDKDQFLVSILCMVGGFISGVIGTILTTVVILIASVLCYSRKIEFGLRSVFLPMAIADVSGTGTSGPGMRYLKKLFGVALQAGAIIFLFLLTARLSADSVVSGLVLPIAMLGAMGTAKKIAEEAMGG